MSSSLVIDVETSTFGKGNVYSQRNKLYYVGLLKEEKSFLLDVEGTDSPHGEVLALIQKEIDEAKELVLFNGKFDLSWLRRYGINFSHKKIHDCQLCHFILTHQANPYPSLNGVAEYYGLGQKIDVVREQYWDIGLDTSDVPKEILELYLEQDLNLTSQVYLRQVEEINALPVNKQRLISLHNQDLVALQEIEWNGIKYDSAESEKLATELAETISLMESEMFKLHSLPGFNNSSKHHLSCLLYGGVFTLPEQQDTGEVFKTGPKAGQKKLKWVDIPHEFPRLVTPLRNTAYELNKNESDVSLHRWGVGADILTRLPAKGKAKKVVDIILKRSILEKLRGTYYEGLPKLIKEMDWEEDTLHGNLNQNVAVTGRLSSTKPNLQNMSGELKPLFYSRYSEVGKDGDYL